jgi:hypothetical protein
MAAVPVNLPLAPVRDRGLLTQVAPRIPADAYLADRGEIRWVRDGVVWRPWMYREPQVDAATDGTVYAKDPDAIVDPVEYASFLLWDSLFEGTLSNERAWMEQNTSYTIESLVSVAIAGQLEAAAPLSGGPSLPGDVTYPPTIVEGAAVAVSVAVASLEQFLADALHGAVGMIHLTPAQLVAAHIAEAVYWDGSTYRSPGGHCVVGDPGHAGQATPQGGSAPAAGQAWAYATSTVFWDVSPAQNFTATSVSPDSHDLMRNVEKPLKERYGIVVFDPNVVGAALVA